MLYRSFPLIPDKNISVLGFGLMRLPLCTNNRDGIEIDYGKTKNLIQKALDEGINYFDTAYPYHQGNSETVLGSIVKELDVRKSIYIADKMPLWDVKTHQDMITIFNHQLKKLKTDYIDFYLIHAMNKERWEHFVALDGAGFIAQMKAEGKLHHIGFSFHDTPEVFRTITNGYSGWEFCQLQYNYLDSQHINTEECIKVAGKHNLGVVVMEPLRGGLLANPPRQIIDLFAQAQKPRTPAEWALRWVWENQQVVCALSGMNSENQLVMNIAAASSAKPNSLPKSQLETIEKAGSWFRERIAVPCTGCGYCVPCSQKVDIPAVFSTWNDLSLNGKLEDGSKAVSASYRKLKDTGRDASKCIACHVCEKKCPQHIAVADFLLKALSFLDI